MRRENVKEYELLRNEVRDVKNFITSYMGFSLGGSAFAFIVIDNSSAGDAISPFVAFIPISIALVITLVLLIIYYKFNSHNRYAGYCKLLNEETWTIQPAFNEDVYTWEICIGQLRHFDTHQNELIGLCGDVTIDVENKLDKDIIRRKSNNFSADIQKILRIDPDIDKKNGRDSICLFAHWLENMTLLLADSKYW